MPHRVHLFAVAIALAIGPGLAGGPGRSAAGEPVPAAIQQDEQRVAQFSGDPNRPRRHARIANPATLKPTQAQEIYRGLIGQMAAGYGASGDPVAASYRGWTRYNSGPYRSVTHGRRFVNNYANEVARNYGKFEGAGRLPVGSIIAKDSFTVTTEGGERPGPLFIMEKMAAGFNYVTGDWRYTMIKPDGEVFGITRGQNAKRVDYCIGCHLAREAYDHLFFVPKEVRTTSSASTD